MLSTWAKPGSNKLKSAQHESCHSHQLLLSACGLLGSQEEREEMRSNWQVDQKRKAERISENREPSRTEGQNWSPNRVRTHCLKHQRAELAIWTPYCKVIELDKKTWSSERNQGLETRFQLFKHNQMKTCILTSPISLFPDIPSTEFLGIKARKQCHS